MTVYSCCMNYCFNYKTNRSLWFWKHLLQQLGSQSGEDLGILTVQQDEWLSDSSDFHCPIHLQIPQEYCCHPAKKHMVRSPLLFLVPTAMHPDFSDNNYCIAVKAGWYEDMNHVLVEIWHLYAFLFYQSRHI